MPGRHAAPARRTEQVSARRGPGRVAAVAGLALVVILAVIMQSLLASSQSGDSCDDPEALTLAASPEIAGVMQRASDEIQDGDLVLGDSCAEVRVSARTPIDVLDAVQSNSDVPDLWVSDTSYSLSALPDAQQDRKTWWFAKSPLVLLGKEGEREPRSWLQALSNPGSAGFNPGQSSVGLAALAALHAEALIGETTGAELSRWLAAAAIRGEQQVPDVDDTIDAMREGDASAPSWVPLSEQAVLASDAGDEGLTITVPETGSVLLDYPLVVLAEEGKADIATAAGQSMVDYLSSKAGRDMMAAQGFRPQSGAPIEGESDLGQVRENTTMQSANVSELVQLWTTLSLDARILAVVDVSGSMNETDGGVRTRAEVTRDAMATAIEVMPASWQLGVWAFSIGLGGATDYRTLVDTNPLGEKGSAQRSQLAAAAEEITSLAGGGTALYDTTLAAFREAQRNYDPESANSIVLMTDGQNEDADGLTLDALLQTLESEIDPDRPVEITTIGLGPEADIATLEEISRVTESRTYAINNPSEIDQVLSTELLERVGWALG